MSDSFEVGILALQGDFAAHAAALAKAGARPRLVKTAEAMTGIAAIVLPGGESSAMLKLMSPELSRALCTRITAGLPVLATCAGVILLARSVSQPAQDSLGLLDIDVERNAYGRQIDSFIEEKLQLTEAGAATYGAASQIEGVFIRAPRITRIGKDVEVLALQQSDPVMLREKNMLAMTFHPEMSEHSGIVYRRFLAFSESASIVSGRAR